MMQEHFHSSYPPPMASWIHEENIREQQQSMIVTDHDHEDEDDDLEQIKMSIKEKMIKKGSGTSKKLGAVAAGVRLSTDPQSVAARQRRHRISDRFRVLKSLVPGGSKMDTVSMLEEAIHYVKFLKAQIWFHQAALMIPADDHDHDQYSHGINYGCDFAAVPEAAGMAGMAYGDDQGGGIYNPFSRSTPEERMIYSLPAAAATPAPAAAATLLPSFPYCSFQQVVVEEEETLPPQGGFNY